MRSASSSTSSSIAVEVGVLLPHVIHQPARRRDDDVDAGFERALLHAHLDAAVDGRARDRSCDTRARESRPRSAPPVRASARGRDAALHERGGPAAQGERNGLRRGRSPSCQAVSNLCRVGTTNAQVLPVPVSAHAMTIIDRPSASGMTALWIGRVSVKPRSRMPSSRRASRSSDANATGATSQSVGSSAGVVPRLLSAARACVRSEPRRGRLSGGASSAAARRRRRSVVLEFNSCSACAEGDDAADRIVRRDADGHAIAWNDLDAEAAHAAAELCQHLVSGVALHAVETAAVHRNDRALHVDQIVLAQTATLSFHGQSIIVHTPGLSAVTNAGGAQRLLTASSTCFASAS